MRIAGELEQLISCGLAESTDRAYHSELNRWSVLVMLPDLTVDCTITEMSQQLPQGMAPADLAFQGSVSRLPVHLRHLIELSTGRHCMNGLRPRYATTPEVPFVQSEDKSFKPLPGPGGKGAGGWGVGKRVRGETHLLPMCDVDGMGRGFHPGVDMPLGTSPDPPDPFAAQPCDG